jgi:hypothetical protein
MGKKVLIITFLLLVFFQGTASALETEGEILFRDSLYGAAIGALIGSAVYLIDQEDFVEKVGTGLVVGTVGGLIFGFTETRSLVEIETSGNIAIKTLKALLRVAVMCSPFFLPLLVQILFYFLSVCSIKKG